MNNNKNNDLIEKFKLALTSTAKVISDDFSRKINPRKNNDPKNLEFLTLENLKSKNDFIKARAESDSSALKKKFSDDKIHKKNQPNNTSCRSLYSIAEKIRYEALGASMLKGIEKNLKDNYSQIIQSKKKNQIKSKEDVSVSEAIELYILKKFHNIELNPVTNNMLNFW